MGEAPADSKRANVVPALWSRKRRQWTQKHKRYSRSEQRSLSIASVKCPGKSITSRNQGSSDTSQPAGCSLFKKAILTRMKDLSKNTGSAEV